MSEVEKLGKVRDAAILQGMLPYIKQEVAAITHELDNKTLMRISNGEYTATDALNDVLERNAYIKLVNRLEMRVKLGQADKATIDLLNGATK